MNAKKRKQKLLELLVQIIKGKFPKHEVIDLNKLYVSPGVPARQQYQSPVERTTYNYGYMTSGEIGAGNQESN